MNSSLFILVLGVLTYSVRPDEICCGDLGCFNNDSGPLSHLPLPQCPGDIGLAYYLITRENPEEPMQLTKDVVPDMYDVNKTSIIIVHGWRNDAETDWVKRIVKGILNHYDANIVVVDWADGAGKLYYTKSAANTAVVGASIAYIFDGMHDEGEDFLDMWCIGFSLGAHACGHAGMRLDGRIGRITGLDPAGPGFRARDLKAGLNKDAAKFVDVIHTDGSGYISYYGMLEPRGHMDFYPNGGVSQPGCYFGYKRGVPYNAYIGCDHGRSVELFLAGLEIEGCLTSSRICKDPKKMPKQCEPSDEVIMGHKANQNIQPGMYYLETAKEAPWCKYIYTRK